MENFIKFFLNTHLEWSLSCQDSVITKELDSTPEHWLPQSLLIFILYTVGLIPALQVNTPTITYSLIFLASEHSTHKPLGKRALAVKGTSQSGETKGGNSIPSLGVQSSPDLQIRPVIYFLSLYKLCAVIHCDGYMQEINGYFLKGRLA